MAISKLHLPLRPCPLDALACRIVLVAVIGVVVAVVSISRVVINQPLVRSKVLLVVLMLL